MDVHTAPSVVSNVAKSADVSPVVLLPTNVITPNELSG